MTHRQATHRARALRAKSTDAERELWFHLRDRRLGGHKFKRQHPLLDFIADFACAESHLIVELDGSQHLVRSEYDARRSQVFAANGWHVLRFWNNDVLTRTEGVLEEILRTLGGPHPNPSPAPRERGSSPRDMTS